jgi:isopenicillin-N epimerase
MPGGWPEVMASNRKKALAARALLCERLRVAPPCPEDMVGSMAVVGLPDGYPERPEGPLGLDPLQVRLFDEHRIEVPIVPWPKAPGRHVRVSAQLYNTHTEYQALADALDALLR